MLGIGNAIVDVLAHCDDEFLAAEGLVKGSMNLIEVEQSKALYGRMGSAVEVSGGAAANSMAGIASFGGRAAYIGKIRDDQVGEVFAHDIRAEGVHFDTPVATDGPPTALSLILVTPDAHRTMSTYLGAADLKPVVAFFESGGNLKLDDDAPSHQVVAQLRRVPHLFDHLKALGVAAGDPEPVIASAAEFVLEGLHARKQIGRSDDRGFVAAAPVPESDLDIERLERLRRLKKQVN